METSQRQRIEQYCNKQFYEALESNQRLKIFQGGSRSGKTYSIMQYLLYLITVTKEPLVIRKNSQVLMFVINYTDS